MANLIYGTDITSDTITREQIVSLRQGAIAAGDDAQADICGQALAGDEDSILECERVIADAQSQDGIGRTQPVSIEQATDGDGSEELPTDGIEAGDDQTNLF